MLKVLSLLILSSLIFINRVDILNHIEIRTIQKQFDADTKEFGLKSSPVRFKFVTREEIKVHPPKGFTSNFIVAAGGCEPSTKEIRINQDTWSRMNPRDKTILAYHELGHCALGLEHFNYFNEEIMNWFTSGLTNLDWNTLRSRMFTRAQIEQSLFIQNLVTIKEE